MIDMLGSLVTGVLSGGATGLLGLLLQGWFKAKERAQDIEVLKLNHANALALRQQEAENELKLAGLQAESAERLAELRAQAQADQSAGEDYRASLEHDKATHVPTATLEQLSKGGGWGKFVAGLVTLLLGLVDAVRGFVRPGVTVYTLGLQTMLLLWVNDMFARKLITLAQPEQQRLVMEVVTTTSFLVTTCVVWWFGARPPARR
jgi:hypothetical protein